VPNCCPSLYRKLVGHINLNLLRGELDLIGLEFLAVVTAPHVAPSKTIKNLVGGKNSSAPEKAEEHPLEELGSLLSTCFGGKLGIYSSLILCLVGRKVDSIIKTYLSETWSLVPLQQLYPKRLSFRPA